MAAPDFLSLPLELRRGVYGYLTPFHCYISECVGLALCCKQVYSEYKAEVCLQMKSIHNRIAKEWPTISDEPLQVTGGKTLDSMHRMTVLLPRKMYSLEFQSHPGWPDSPRIPACLRPIFFLYLHHLEFGLLPGIRYEDNDFDRYLDISYGCFRGADMWAPALMVGLREFLVPREENVPVMQAKTMCFHLGNRRYTNALMTTNFPEEAWRSTCVESNYRCSVDVFGTVHLRRKPEAESQRDSEDARYLELAVNAMLDS